jgi:hypothetical protein
MNESDRKIVELALERFGQAEEAEAEFRRAFKEDLRFVSDDQWDPLARQQRTESSRPCFTVDRINPALRQIVNEERQNRPSIEVLPKSDGADQTVANTIEGLIRHIEYDSKSDSQFDQAGWYAAAAGLGYLRIRNEYETDVSFDQKLLIESIPDPLSVFFDPNSVQPDGSDANWCFIVDRIPKDQFSRQYPEAKLTKDVESLGGWNNYNASNTQWIDDKTVLLAEYYYRDWEPATLYQLLDNNTGEVIVSLERPPQDLLDTNMLTILNTRSTTTATIRWCLLTSTEILDRSTFAGKHIPVVRVVGEEYYVDGQRYICGAVRRARDAQKLLNWTTSLQAEIVDLNAKAPWIGAAGQFDTFEDNWRDANRKNFGYLEYNTTDVNGNPVGPPNRNAVEAPIAAVQATKMQSVEDIKAIFGIFDASLGAMGNETSGVAIAARKQQSGVSNYHYYDNLVRAVRQIGKILVDVIPYYYDTKRMIRVVKPNGDNELVLINGVDKQGRMIDFSQGEYDVVVSTGPGYSTRRQEMVEKAISLIQAYPQSAPLIADLVVNEMDFEGSKMIARRLRAAVPPEILLSSEEETGNDLEGQVQALTAQLKQAQQSLEALNAHAAQVEQQLSAEKTENILMKMKADVEVRKAELDQGVKMKGYELEEQRTELEFLIKEQELIIQRKQLELEQAKLAVAGVKTMAGIEDKLFEREAETIERVARAKPGEGEMLQKHQNPANSKKDQQG